MNQKFDNYQFLLKYFQLQNSIMFDGFIELNHATIAYSQTDPTQYWNIALVNSNLSDTQIDAIEEKFVEIDRKPTILFQNTPTMQPLIEKITKHGYKKNYEDSFQFWQGGKIDTSHFESVKKVETKADLTQFLATFDSCYQNNDPQNPYGELGDYLKVAEDVWHKHHTTNRLEYFIVYMTDTPVAVATLTNFEGLGYISNVGSLKSVRGKGFGKAATLYCIQQSINNDNSEHCLATEEGHYPDAFYKNIGFDTQFSALGYTKM